MIQPFRILMTQTGDIPEKHWAYGQQELETSGRGFMLMINTSPVGSNDFSSQ